jgi:LmbE family N-acetylglucosaminyl deacetylase
MQGPVLVFAAHADDTEFFAGGTVARFAAEGRDVYEVIATDNGRGSFDMDQAALVAQSRDREAREAARVLGKKDVFFLGYPDGFLEDTRRTVLREQFMRFVRRIRPAIVMSFDPFAPYEPHPDHRAVAFAAMEAVSFGHMPLFHPEHRADGLLPHLAGETWYFAKNPRETNRVVDVSEYIDRKVDALCAHESQMRLTIGDIRMSIQVSGEGSDLLPLLDRDDYRPAIDLFIRQWAASVGGRSGCAFGEEFRVERAGDLVRALALAPAAGEP